MVFLLAVFGRKVYWFKLLSELLLNSGYDYLTPGLVHHRQESLPRHYADRPISHGYPIASRLPQPSTTPFSSLRVAGRGGHEWFISG
jgi:hypothetical protein